MKINKIFVFLFFCLLSITTTAQASGYLFVSPQRVVLSDQNTAGQLHLVNKSDQTKTYKIELVDYHMNEKGQLIKGDFPYSAAKFIKISPRRVTLQAGQDQYIRLMARIPKKYEDGETHTHIEFSEVEQSRDAQQDDTINKNEKKLSFSVGTAYGVAIPVFVQKGNIEAKIDIQKTQFLPSKNKKQGSIKIDLTREGNRSLYQKISVDYQPPKGKTIEILPTSYIALYREINHTTHNLHVSIPENSKQRFSGGKLILKLMSESNEHNNNSEVINTLDISVPR